MMSATSHLFYDPSLSTLLFLPRSAQQVGNVAASAAGESEPSDNTIIMHEDDSDASESSHTSADAYPCETCSGGLCLWGSQVNGRFQAHIPHALFVLPAAWLIDIVLAHHLDRNPGVSEGGHYDSNQTEVVFGCIRENLRLRVNEMRSKIGGIFESSARISGHGVVVSVILADFDSTLLRVQRNEFRNLKRSNGAGKVIYMAYLCD